MKLEIFLYIIFIIFICYLFFILFKKIDYHFKRKSYILRFLEIKEKLLNIKSNINEIDPINLKRINYMIDDTINLIDFYDGSQKTIEQMQIDLDDMLHNFEILKEGQKSVTEIYK